MWFKNMKTQEIISIKLERDPPRNKRQYRPDLTVFLNTVFALAFPFPRISNGPSLGTCSISWLSITVFNLLQFQTGIMLGNLTYPIIKCKILSFLMMYHTCLNSKYKYLFSIFLNFPTLCFKAPFTTITQITM